MNRTRPQNLASYIAGLLLCFAFAYSAFAQADTDPNSPTPVLLLSPTTTTTDKGISRTSKIRSQTLIPDSKITLYVANVVLMPGEDETAFRVYGEDDRGLRFRFPVVGLEPYDKHGQVYTLAVHLRDDLEPRDELFANGDLIVSVAWRGLLSNRIRMGANGTASKAPDETNVIGNRWSGDRARLFEQATFGSTPALDDRVRRIGLRTWITEQFELPYPSASNPYPNFPLRPTNPVADCNGQIDGGFPDPDPFCFVNHYTMYPMQNWFYKEAFYGDAQLRHRVAWALSQLWVISGIETQQSSHMAAYHKVLARNAFGNWRTLMQEMTLNPGMGDFLNMRTSTRFSPNENYAREILQLFNIGLFMLNPNGTQQTNQQGNPIPTYDQITVNNFTLVFTGWSLCETSPTLCPNRSPGSPNFIDPMIVTNTNNHDLTAKTLLTYPGSTTTNIPACAGCTGTAITTYATNSLNQALDNIYNHPNTAPFVSKFLIQQMVTGDPTPAYVGRVASVFNANRTSSTQMKEVIKAILFDPEARGDVKTDPRYGKLREPVLLATNLARQFDVRSFDCTALSDGVLTNETNAMGQVAFMSPSVFNYYPPDYVVPATTIVGPEFGVFTTGTSVARINFVNTMLFDGGIAINTERRVTSGTSISLAEYAGFAAEDPSGNQLMNMLNLRLMHGAMSPQMRSTILNAVLTVPASNPLLRAKRAAYLVATSTQYQIQR